MSCTGYDSRTVKIPKSVKRSASTIMNVHKRGSFIRSYVQILISDINQSKYRNFKERYK
jgi:hypothetical protein